MELERIPFIIKYFPKKTKNIWRITRV